MIRKLQKNRSQIFVVERRSCPLNGSSSTNPRKKNLDLNNFEPHWIEPRHVKDVVVRSILEKTNSYIIYPHDFLLGGV